MQTVNAPLEVRISSYPAAGAGVFPIGCAEPMSGFNRGLPVRCVIVLPGIGDVIEKMSIATAMGKGYYYIPPGNNYSLFGSVCVYPLVFVLVQTTEASAFRNGEIDFAKKWARENYNVVEFELCAVSLGGFGALQWFDTVEKLRDFRHLLFDMPGGNGNVGAQFPAVAVAAGVECLFVHANDDTLAKPAQSIKMDTEIKRLGGKSQIVLYEKGAHTIMTRPWGAWYPVKIDKDANPWRMWATSGDYKVVEGKSDKPELSLYEWYMSSAVVADELLFIQGIWQRPDGTVYAKEYSTKDI